MNEGNRQSLVLESHTALVEPPEIASTAGSQQHSEQMNPTEDSNTFPLIEDITRPGFPSHANDHVYGQYVASLGTATSSQLGTVSSPGMGSAGAVSLAGTEAVTLSYRSDEASHEFSEEFSEVSESKDASKEGLRADREERQRQRHTQKQKKQEKETREQESKEHIPKDLSTDNFAAIVLEMRKDVKEMKKTQAKMEKTVYEMAERQRDMQRTQFEMKQTIEGLATKQDFSEMEARLQNQIRQTKAINEQTFRANHETLNNCKLLIAANTEKISCECIQCQKRSRSQDSIEITSQNAKKEERHNRRTHSSPTAKSQNNDKEMHSETPESTKIVFVCGPGSKEIDEMDLLVALAERECPVFLIGPWYWPQYRQKNGSPEALMTALTKEMGRRVQKTPDINPYFVIKDIPRNDKDRAAALVFKSWAYTYELEAKSNPCVEDIADEIVKRFDFEHERIHRNSN